jgi:hypothetical protein
MLGFIQSGSGGPLTGGGSSRRKKWLVAAGLAGGIALASVVVTQSTQVQLTTSSTPGGIVASSAFHEAGTTVSVTPPPQTSNGFRFSYWNLNGVRQQDGNGISVNAFNFKILENTQAVAVYVAEAADTDADGIPDWYEYVNYGDLLQNPESDTDGDGVVFYDEYLKGSQPRIRDSAADGGIAEGGISRRRGEKIAVVVGAGWHPYSETSTPPGVVSRNEYLPTGTRVTTANLSGEHLGHRFAQWKLNGVRQESGSGIALSQVNFTIEGATSAVAEYLPTVQDSDADGIPDWYEMQQYGTLLTGPEEDTDGDGRSLFDEYTSGTQPRISDSASDGSILEGGISRRRGEKMALAFAEEYVRYIETSNPPGVVSRDTYLTLGTSVSTPNAPTDINGYKFGQWTINGARQESPAGIAKSQVTFTLSGETTAVAHYFFATQDGDADQIPDWYEIQQYGSLANGGESDTDEDGVDFLTEYQRGTQPRIYDSAADGGIVEGGISRRRGEKMVLNLQFFPAERKVLLGNQLGDFFGDPYNGVAGNFTVGAGGVAAPALGDLDGDGDLDMVVGGAGGVLRIFENNGSPLLTSFSERAGWLAGLPGLPVGLVYPAFGDWNGDGRADLAVGSDDGVVRFYRSNGFASAPTAAGTLSAGTGAVVPAFLRNEAGGVDLLVLQSNGAVARHAYTGNALAPYANPASSGSILPDMIVNGRALSVADVNGDGRLDVLASDVDGRMWFFRALEAGGYFLNSKVWGGTGAGFAQDLRSVVADLNGDGSPDLVGGTAAGGLVHLRNPEKKLRLDPPLKTVVTGERVPFRSIDNDGTLKWSLVRNASGAAINESTGEYVAGPNAGVDAVMARNAAGLTGVAWVNVIAPGGAVDGIGSALVVAGRRGPNDPVWTATRALANRAYEVLRYRGLQAGDVAFLSHATGDVGVDGLPTRAGIQAALNTATGKPALLLYLVDHGRVAPGGEDGLFLLGKDEQFSGTELDGWLDAYQAANPQTEVTVILECCYADRLAAKVMAGNPAKRAVFSSASANQVAHMAAAGAVSYSSMLWSELSLGKTLEEAHAVAAEAMQRFQAAVGRDPGGIARRGMGMSGVSKVARPAVGSVVLPQTLAGTAVARLWAGGVDGSFPIERVWAVVVPPDYAADGDAPVVDLPEIELMWNASSREYEMEYGGFTEGGPDAPYTVMFYARDIWGQVSLPVVTTVTQTSAVNRVVILSHGHENNPGAAKKAGLVADFAHETALLRRVREENIRYLGEGFANPRVTNLAGAENLRQSIVNWTLPAGKALNALTVYLVGEGSLEGLVCGNGDVVSPAMLKGWLDTLQGATGCAVHVVVDSDYSGRFVPGLSSAAYERVVMASCGANQRNPGNSEWASLSRWLWLAIAKGQDLRSSFGFASDLMRLLGPVPFLLDDDGDGVYDRGKDGFKALAAFIGAAFVTADDPPYIGLASPPAVCGLNDTVNIWAANVVMPDGNAPVKVWAELVGPDGAVVQTVEMLWNKVYERYDGFVGGFGAAGRYMALVYAGDPANPRTVSNPAPVQIFAGTTPTGAGAGGSAAGLELPLNGAVFDASIEAGGAAFETRLLAAPGQRVTVEVFGVGSGRNVELSIVGPNGTELAKRDDWGNGFGERIWAWEPTAAGNYTVRVAAAASSGRTDFSVRGFLQQETVDVGSRLAQAIVFNAPASWSLSNGTLALNATATSGLAPELEVVSGNAVVSNRVLSANGSGAVVLRARQDGNGVYGPAAPVLRTLEILGGRENYTQWAARHFGGEVAQRGGESRDDDGDGMSNRMEYLADTDPRDGKSKFQIEAGERKAGGFEIRWEGKAGINYRVLWSGNLTGWSEVPNSRRTGRGQQETHTDTDATGGRKFYRVEVVE